MNRHIHMLTTMMLGIFVMLSLFASPASAAFKEYTVETHYIMSDNDTFSSAEERALFNAKKIVLHQAANDYPEAFSELENLTEEQLKVLMDKTLSVDVLSKSKSFKEQSMMFSVMIKAIVDTTKVGDANSTAKQALPKPKKIGVVMYVNKQVPRINDLQAIHPYTKPYTMDNFVQDYRILETMRGIVSERYSTQGINLEMGDKINNMFFAYMKETCNFTADSNLSIIKSEQLAEFALRNNYDDILVVSPRFTRIDKKTEFIRARVTVESDWNIMIYDAKTRQLIYANNKHEVLTSVEPGNDNDPWGPQLTRLMNQQLNIFRERIFKELPSLQEI